MDSRRLGQLKKLEAEILSRELTPAKPVGLRYDRLAREGWLPGPARAAVAPLSRAYWTCNGLAVRSLLQNRLHVFTHCEEGWVWEVAAGGTSFAGRPSAGRADAVLADSSILLSGELADSLSGFRRVLGAGGRVVLLVANWEHEMEGAPERYDLSFRLYRGNVHAGLVKRTLEPALEVEYVCLLDASEPEVRKLAQLPRDELRLLGAGDVPGLERLVTAVEVIRIPQATVRSLAAAGREAGYSRTIVGGAPGILAGMMESAAHLLDTGAGQADEILQALASSFPFVPAAGSPHLLAVFIA